jgi:hypothetical protein
MKVLTDLDGYDVDSDKHLDSLTSVQVSRSKSGTPATLF